jgi:hypothetical protein
VNADTIEVYAWFTAMVGVAKALPADERDALVRWEAKNLGKRGVGTSDWPGWEKYIGIRPMRSASSKSERAGFVYLVRSAVGLYKIGRSRSVIDRFRSICTASPVAVELIHFISCDDRISAEAQLHKRFNDVRRRGEWFELDDGQIREICQWACFRAGEFRPHERRDAL